MDTRPGLVAGMKFSGEDPGRFYLAISGLHLKPCLPGEISSISLGLQKTRKFDRINRISRISRISNQRPEAADCISHRQRRVIAFWPGFRPGQKCFSLHQSLNPVNPVKKTLFFIGLRTYSVLEMFA